MFVVFISPSCCAIFKLYHLFINHSVQKIVIPILAIKIYIIDIVSNSMIAGVTAVFLSFGVGESKKNGN
ncbi:MAG: hypothetical protein COX19_00730 [Desulfobacterales bacterium CG23_combo_of_CG06-09_8_20_14_all_51_8]|nr:MAG: hypothetical protein COX19_00730 [Desulfobacterales bacterium CG23_combo_of_CG06-09_8_20_14_all_51_8]